jgi:glycoside hydrolase-like protein
MRLFRLAAFTAILALSYGDAAFAAGGPLSGLKEVGYAGSTVEVPVSWPVHDLTADPHTCMRYDRHAVYLGDPGPDQNCPAGVVGQTDTVRIASNGTVTRTYGYRASADDERGAPQAVPPVVQARSHIPDRAVKAAATYSGLGFDTCAAPSTDAMKTWAGASPYHAVGIYVGGSDRACPDGNLTPNWIQTVARQGWKLFPIYVGLQAPCWKDPGGGHPAVIARSRRWTQGQDAANDAANRAAYFGIAPGSPIYFDMEYYPRDDTGCTQDVQAFLSAWTDQLHARGFVSGIYSSSKGAIADMALVYDKAAVYRADVAWYAHWDKVPTVFGDRTLSDKYWPGPRRIKQYQGGHTETYGGKRLNIDLNVLDAPVAALK